MKNLVFLLALLIGCDSEIFHQEPEVGRFTSTVNEVEVTSKGYIGYSVVILKDNQTGLCYLNEAHFYFEIACTEALAESNK